jgi:hypothetical protein
MIAQLRYNLKIVAPTLIWTGVLMVALSGLVLAGSLSVDSLRLRQVTAMAETFFPLIAGFFTAGVLDAEMKRGAHELLCSKREPLWRTLLYRVAIVFFLAMLVGFAVLLIIHFTALRLPIGRLLLVTLPGALLLGMVALWVRLSLGSALMGYLSIVGIWILGQILQALQGGPGNPSGINVNPLFNLSSYADFLEAEARHAVATTPYVDWWWVNKAALVMAAAAVFWIVTRRVETQAENE